MKYLPPIFRGILLAAGLTACSRDYSFLEHGDAEHNDTAAADMPARYDAPADHAGADRAADAEVRRDAHSLDGRVDVLARDLGRDAPLSDIPTSDVSIDRGRPDAPADAPPDYRADVRGDRRTADAGTSDGTPRHDGPLSDGAGNLGDTFSPDVRTYADLLPADAGRADRLSPDGSVADGSAPDQSADAAQITPRRLIFRSNRTGDYDIYSIDPENPADVVNLTNHPAYDEQASQSLDGRVAFVSNRDGGGIFVMSGDGSEVRRIAASGQRPTWSPDGRIAYSTGAQLYAINADGTGQVPLGGPCADPCRNPSWSPDGRRIAYYADSGGLRILNLSDGSVRSITSRGILPDYGPNEIIVFHQDGTLRTIRSDGLELRDFGFYGYEPSFSADGRRIAFASAANRIQIYNPVSGETVTLPASETEASSDPDW